MRELLQGIHRGGTGARGAAGPGCGGHGCRRYLHSPCIENLAQRGSSVHQQLLIGDGGPGLVVQRVGEQVGMGEAPDVGEVFLHGGDPPGQAVLLPHQPIVSVVWRRWRWNGMPLPRPMLLHGSDHRAGMAKQQYGTRHGVSRGDPGQQQVPAHEFHDQPLGAVQLRWRGGLRQVWAEQAPGEQSGEQRFGGGPWFAFRYVLPPGKSQLPELRHVFQVERLPNGGRAWYGGQDLLQPGRASPG